VYDYTANVLEAWTESSIIGKDGIDLARIEVMSVSGKGRIFSLVFLGK
jgi:hypothetical protein